jgi:hypothetical protein
MKCGNSVDFHRDDGHGMSPIELMRPFATPAAKLIGMGIVPASVGDVFHSCPTRHRHAAPANVHPAVAESGIRGEGAGSRRRRGIMNSHSWNGVGFSSLVGGAHPGVLNETRYHRTFYRRSHRFRACRVCARCIKQDTRPRDAGKGLQERQPWCFRLRSGAGDAGEGLEEWESGCVRLRAWSDQRLEYRRNEWSKLYDNKV